MATIEQVVRQQSEILNQQRAALAALTKVVTNQAQQLADARTRLADLEDWAGKQGGAAPQTVDGHVVQAAAGGGAVPSGPGANPADHVERAMRSSNRLPEPGDENF